MRKVRVVSTKYDGSLRDEYETNLYSDSDKTIILYSPPGLRYWDYRKSTWFEASDGILEIYFKHKWFNVWHIAEQVSNINLVYVNISLPATIQEKLVEWTDLDIDYRVHLDNSVECLDHDEFDQNVQCLNYPPDLIEQVWKTCREVEDGLASRTFPFDYERQVALYHHIMSNL